MNFVDQRYLTKKTCNLCAREFEANSPEDRCPTDGVILSLQYSDPLLGTVVADRYEITSYLGQGGWSTVYRARHRLLHSDVAMKVLHGHLLNDAEKLQRFEAEAKILSRLNHAGIVKVLDFGLVPRPFIVMELCEGITLAEYVTENGRLSTHMFLAIFKQVCAALEAAHASDLVHRDLKPSNIMLLDPDHNLRVKILDFGLAKVLDSAVSLTQTGEAMGSPPYMSPEHFQGERLTCSSDIYSVGCVMYEAITGKPPYSADTTMEYMSKHLKGKPRPFAKDFGEDRNLKAIEQLVFTAMDKQPRGRYESVMALRAALEALECGRFSLYAFITNSKRRRRKLTVLLLNTLLSVSLLMIPVVIYWPEIAAWICADSFKQGVQYLDQGMLKQADLSLNRALWAAGYMRKFDPLRISTLRTLARCYKVEGKATEAEALEARLELDIGSHAPPELIEVFSRAKYHMNVAVNLAQAEKLALRAMEMTPADEPSVNRAACLDLLGQIERMRHNFVGAEKHLIEGLKMRELLLDPNEIAVVQSMNNTAQLYRNLGKYTLAEQLYQKGLAIAVHQNSNDWRALTRTLLNNLGSAYFSAARFNEAEMTYLQALDLSRRWFGAESNPTAHTMGNLSQVYWREGRVREAIAGLKESMAIYEKLGLGANPDRETSWTNLGRMYADQHLNKEAEDCFKRGISLRERSDPTHPGLKTAYEEYAGLLRKCGRMEEAAKYERKQLQLSNLPTISPSDAGNPN